jgi:HSP20 family molecular chaperone IbpA
MLNVDEAIREVGAVFQTVAGRPIQVGPSELPPEADPIGHVEAKYWQLRGLLERTGAVAPTPAWSPVCDVLEHEREVRIEIELPGVPRDRLNVTAVGDHLVVRGERPNGRLAGAVVRHQERTFGPFQRIIALPPRVRRDAIEASFSHGVLILTMPIDGNAEAGAEVSIPIK